MLLVEPCCTQKHLLALRNKLGDSGTAFFHGYGDVSLSELLPSLLVRYSEADMVIAAPSIPDGAAGTIAYWMNRQWARSDGKGKTDVVARLLLVTDLRPSKSPMASQWLDDNPFGERLELRSVQQNDTAIILPDIAFLGNVNLTYGGHFTAVATKNTKTIGALRSQYRTL